MSLKKQCNFCARRCKVDRLAGETGFCRASHRIKIALADLHFWEEPCISGQKGSGTVFFSYCCLACVFCQNYTISQYGEGKEVSIERLADIFLELQEKKAHNINLVTPTHYVGFILPAIQIAKKKGLSLPIVYNTNSYETLETIEALRDYIDIYLPDFKYFDNQYSLRYSGISDYFEVASQGIRKMVENQPRCIFDQNGIMQKGVLVRHLLLPGLLSDSKRVIKFLFENFGNQIYYSLMNQFTPVYLSYRYPELREKVEDWEYEALLEYADKLGIENAFIQGDGTSTRRYIPDFDKRGV